MRGPESKTEQTAEDILAWAEQQKEALAGIADILPAVRKLNIPPSFRKVLIVKYLPGSDKWPTTRKAELAGISERQWYYVIHDKRFLDAAVQFVKEHLGQDIEEVWRTYLTQAKAGNYINAEKILTELGIFQRQKQGDTNITVNVAVVEDTRAKNVEAGLNRFRFTTAGGKDEE